MLDGRLLQPNNFVQIKIVDTYLMSVQVFKIQIESKRVQTVLFSIPKLRPMLGTNVLLGETLRRALCQLARHLRHQRFCPPQTVIDAAELTRFHRHLNLMKQ